MRRVKGTYSRRIPADARHGVRWEEVPFDEGRFHCWGVQIEELYEGTLNNTVAIVELPDGRVVTPAPGNIQFHELSEEAIEAIDELFNDGGIGDEGAVAVLQKWIEEAFHFLKDTSFQASTDLKAEMREQIAVCKKAIAAIRYVGEHRDRYQAKPGKGQV